MGSTEGAKVMTAKRRRRLKWRKRQAELQPYLDAARRLGVALNAQFDRDWHEVGGKGPCPPAGPIFTNFGRGIY